MKLVYDREACILQLFVKCCIRGESQWTWNTSIGKGTNCIDKLQSSRSISIILDSPTNPLDSFTPHYVIGRDYNEPEPAIPNHCKDDTLLVLTLSARIAHFVLVCACSRSCISRISLEHVICDRHLDVHSSRLDTVQYMLCYSMSHLIRF